MIWKTSKTIILTGEMKLWFQPKTKSKQFLAFSLWLRNETGDEIKELNNFSVKSLYLWLSVFVSTVHIRQSEKEISSKLLLLPLEMIPVINYMESKKCCKVKIENMKTEFETKRLSKVRSQSHCISRIVTCNIKFFQDNDTQYQHDYVRERCSKVVCNSFATCLWRDC